MKKMAQPKAKQPKVKKPKQAAKPTKKPKKKK
jgi:hypothetical protein